MSRTLMVTAEVETDDVLGEIEKEDLIEELRNRGVSVREQSIIDQLKDSTVKFGWAEACEELKQTLIQDGEFPVTFK